MLIIFGGWGWVGMVGIGGWEDGGLDLEGAILV